jgi:hypothetical protein
MKYVTTGIALLASFPLIAQQSDTGRWRQLSNMAASLLAQADVARQAVAHRDSTAAESAIRQALSETELIQGTAPPADPLMVPISVDFDSSEMSAPARAHHAASRLKRNADIAEATGDYNATILNVTAARQHLEAAQAALYRGDFAAADSDLTGVQQAVTKKTYSGELPLVQARDNLTLARGRALAGNYKDTILPLESASRALDRFAQSHLGTSQANRAEEMHIQIDALAQHITKDHATAVDQITGWWDQVADWFNSGMAQ